MAELATADILIYLLPLLFFIVAFVYGSVGLGGGTAYTALLSLFGVPHTQIPPISQGMNIIVSGSGSYQFIRAGHLRARLILPAILTSMPMAYFGASLNLSKEVFLFVLWLTLLLVGIRLTMLRHIHWRFTPEPTAAIVSVALISAVLGLIAGIVGIGGGIYLVPILLIMNLASAKEAAACGAVFVLLNSLVGFISRFLHHAIDWQQLLPLAIAVLIGGTLGAFFGAKRFSADVLEKILILIVFAAWLGVTHKLWFLSGYNLIAIN